MIVWDILIVVAALSAIGAGAALSIAARHAARFERSRAEHGKAN